MRVRCGAALLRPGPLPPAVTRGRPRQPAPPILVRSLPLCFALNPRSGTGLHPQPKISLNRPSWPRTRSPPEWPGHRLIFPTPPQSLARRLGTVRSAPSPLTPLIARVAAGARGAGPPGGEAGPRAGPVCGASGGRQGGGRRGRAANGGGGRRVARVRAGLRTAAGQQAQGEQRPETPPAGQRSAGQFALPGELCAPGPDRPGSQIRRLTSGRLKRNCRARCPRQQAHASTAGSGAAADCREPRGQHTRARATASHTLNCGSCSCLILLPENQLLKLAPR
ncbi:PREDICTED: translation initiation factor IF-2-like [Chinchilla lanigera]|uniref:translation initiation factor IF-2-like n=1 Tax=Chinchilla lanigera TaxID=34839 RepID=UPI0006975F0D|nr:PREDICTED: translation initiation factor IF-2-like [Chinchilla lanigera]